MATKIGIVAFSGVCGHVGRIGIVVVGGAARGGDEKEERIELQRRGGPEKEEEDGEARATPPIPFQTHVCSTPPSPSQTT
jgi:hypothetical protein